MQIMVLPTVARVNIVSFTHDLFQNWMQNYVNINKIAMSKITKVFEQKEFKTFLLKLSKCSINISCRYSLLDQQNKN